MMQGLQLQILDCSSSLVRNGKNGTQI